MLCVKAGACEELPEKEQKSHGLSSCGICSVLRLLGASNPSGIKCPGVPRSVGSCYRLVLPSNRLERDVDCAPSVLGSALR